MTSGNEQQTRDALEEDLHRQSQRIAELSVANTEHAKEEAERERLSSVLVATHAEAAALKADDEALKASEYDALIDGTKTDMAAAATAIQISNSLRETCIGKLQRLTETRLGAQNVKVLAKEKTVKTIALDLKIIESRIHNSQLLLAASGAAEIGGDLSIRSSVAQRLALEEAQAASDLEQASLALQRELEQQQKIRDARASRGPVSYVNPS